MDLTFKREFSYYLLTIYVPCCMLVIVSWVSFWLDPNAVPGRTTLGTSTWLTMITLTRSTGSDQLPKVGMNSSSKVLLHDVKVNYVKFIDIWFLSCTCFIFLSLLEFAVVNTIWRRK